MILILALRTMKKFQSTLPVGGATFPFSHSLPFQILSIHAPRGGSDKKQSNARHRRTRFQSTLPVGGATCRILTRQILQSAISIHAPRGGSDLNVLLSPCQPPHFNPRSPWGERPKWLNDNGIRLDISIHAPRGGSDVHLKRDGVLRIHDFNPRSPWGERHHIAANLSSRKQISIHAPRGGSDR